MSSTRCPWTGASDRDLLTGLTVDDDDEHDDPVLRYRTAGRSTPGARTIRTPRRCPGPDYEYAKRPLQIELVKLQNWVKSTGERIVIVFEGRDAAARAAPSSGSPST